jgi:hypothetical protein
MITGVDLGVWREWLTWPSWRLKARGRLLIRR